MARLEEKATVIALPGSDLVLDGIIIRGADAEAPGAVIAPPHVPALEAGAGHREGLNVVGVDGHLRKLEEIEFELIRFAIEKYEGHMSEVARRLGIGRSTLYRKLREMGIDEPRAGAA